MCLSCSTATVIFSQVLLQNDTAAYDFCNPANGTEPPNVLVQFLGVADVIQTTYNISLAELTSRAGALTTISACQISRFVPIFESPFLNNATLTKTLAIIADPGFTVDILNKVLAVFNSSDFNAETLRNLLPVFTDPNFNAEALGNIIPALEQINLENLYSVLPLLSNINGTE